MSFSECAFLIGSKINSSGLDQGPTTEQIHNGRCDSPEASHLAIVCNQRCCCPTFQKVFRPPEGYKNHSSPPELPPFFLPPTTSFDKDLRPSPAIFTLALPPGERRPTTLGADTTDTTDTTIPDLTTATDSPTSDPANPSTTDRHQPNQAPATEHHHPNPTDQQTDSHFANNEYHSGGGFRDN